MTASLTGAVRLLSRSKWEPETPLKRCLLIKGYYESLKIDKCRQFCLYRAFCWHGPGSSHIADNVALLAERKGRRLGPPTEILSQCGRSELQSPLIRDSWLLTEPPETEFTRGRGECRALHGGGHAITCHFPSHAIGWHYSHQQSDPSRPSGRWTQKWSYEYQWQLFAHNVQPVVDVTSINPLTDPIHIS